MFHTFLLILLFSTLSNAQSVQPGVWQADSKFKIGGIPLPATHDKNCISKDDAKDLKITLSKELEKKGCQVTKWTTTGEQLNLDLKCDKSGLKAEGNLHGTVTKKSYELSGKAKGSYRRIPASASIELKGFWVEKCAE